MIEMTVRAHIYIVNISRCLTFTLLVAGASSWGCASKMTGKRPLEGKSRVEALHVTGKSQPDTWRYFDTEGDPPNEVLVKEEIDLNGDGKKDMQKQFVKGVLNLRKMDFDFDGTTDQTEFYQEGVLQRVEVSYKTNGKVDTWRFYEEGKLHRIEKDRNADGNADEWLYFEEDQLRRKAVDMNYDGVVDAWTEL